MGALSTSGAQTQPIGKVGFLDQALGGADTLRGDCLGGHEGGDEGRVFQYHQGLAMRPLLHFVRLAHFGHRGDMGGEEVVRGVCASGCAGMDVGEGKITRGASGRDWVYSDTCVDLDVTNAHNPALR